MGDCKTRHGFRKTAFTICVLLVGLPFEDDLFADTLYVPLPGLRGSYSPSTTRVAAFDLQIQLESVNSVSIHWFGTLTPGVGQGDGVEMPIGEPFDWPTQVTAMMDPDGFGMWSVYAGPFDGPFDHEGEFTSYFDLTWDFILDGHGEVTASLSPFYIIGGIMLTPPRGDIDSAMLIVDAQLGCCNIRGDTDHDGELVNISDLIFLIDYMFRDGLAPPCPEEGNINGDVEETIDVSDLVYLVDYMFVGGPEPVVCP